MACAILERTSDFEPSCDIIAPMCLKYCSIFLGIMLLFMRAFFGMQLETSKRIIIRNLSEPLAWGICEITRYSDLSDWDDHDYR